MFGKHFGNYFTHALASSILNAFDAAQQHGVGIDRNFSELSGRFTQRS